jgi:hypothetical protein
MYDAERGVVKEQPAMDTAKQEKTHSAQPIGARAATPKKLFPDAAAS